MQLDGELFLQAVHNQLTLLEAAERFALEQSQTIKEAASVIHPTHPKSKGIPLLLLSVILY